MRIVTSRYYGYSIMYQYVISEQYTYKNAIQEFDIEAVLQNDIYGCRYLSGHDWASLCSKLTSPVKKMNEMISTPLKGLTFD